MEERSLDSFSEQDVQFVNAWLLLLFNENRDRILRIHWLMTKLTYSLSLVVKHRNKGTEEMEYASCCIICQVFINFSLTFNFNSVLYFEAHRALADVQAMRNVLFCTEFKDVVCYYEPLLRTALEQKRKYKAMVQTRERSKSLLLKLGTTLSGNMARKVASEGFTFADLRNLRGRFQEKDQFVQSLRG